jgi:hypothetical protein
MQTQDSNSKNHPHDSSSVVSIRGLVDQRTIPIDIDDPMPNGFQDSAVKESVANRDPLQGGYQDIVDLVEAARSKRKDFKVGTSRPTCFEPDRTVRMDQTSSNIIPPPLRFQSRLKPQQASPNL